MLVSEFLVWILDSSFLVGRFRSNGPFPPPQFAWMWPVRLLALAFNCVWTIRVFDEANKARDVKPPGTAQGYDR